jgi:hypothetical protein
MPLDVSEEGWAHLQDHARAFARERLRVAIFKQLLSQRSFPADDLSQDQLSASEREELAADAAATVNHALANLFLRLGPPPTGASGGKARVPSGGGGAVE